MVARMRPHATNPLERATYHGILLIGQLPPLEVCEVALCVDDAPDEVVADDELVDEPVVLVVAEVDDDVPAFVAALAAICVVAPWPSCHASTPPSASIDATL